MKKVFAVLLICLLAGQYAHAESAWKTIDYPGANETVIRGISGNNLFGTYVDTSGNTHSFLYNGTTLTTLDKPGAISTYVGGIDGNNVVGNYSDAPGYLNGFLYNLTSNTWTNIYMSPMGSIWLSGISGSYMIGNEINAVWSTNAVFYDGTVWTYLHPPLISVWVGTVACGIVRNNIVGSYPVEDYPIYARGFLYNIDNQTWTTINVPRAEFAQVCGIDGTKLVGYFIGYSGQICVDTTNGFFYDMANGTWNIINKPDADFGTYVYGIDGNNLVGSYNDVSGTHGFFYTISRVPIACIVDGNQTVEAQWVGGATVTLDGSCSFDADSTPGINDNQSDFTWCEVFPPRLCNNVIGSGQVLYRFLDMGKHIIALEVTDEEEGISAYKEITVTVQDTTPPEFKLSVTPNVLWPPNHKMVKITPSWTVKDLVDPAPVVSLVGITCNDNSAATDNIQINNDGSIYLRAEKGRIYTITYKACDASGNCTTRSATVTVPHDNGK